MKLKQALILLSITIIIVCVFLTFIGYVIGYQIGYEEGTNEISKDWCNVVNKYADLTNELRNYLIIYEDIWEELPEMEKLNCNFS